MLASSIPFEVLTVIASFLTHKQRIACTTVCKAWSKAFQHSLWYTVEIVDEQKLGSILDPPIIQEDSYKKNGNRVRDLILKKNLGLTNDQLSRLQGYFQKLLSFKTTYNTLHSDIWNTTSNWCHWNLLTNLDMMTDCFDKTDPEEKLLEVISFLPNLRQMKFSEECYTHSHYYYTWETLESIHHALPKLQDLSLDLRFSGIPINSIKSFTDIVPANGLTAFHFKCKNMDIGWHYYFSIKYPNVSTFSAISSYGNEADETLPDAETMMMLESRMFRFPLLSKVDIYNYVCLADHYKILCTVYKDMFKSVTDMTYRLNVLQGLLESTNTIEIDLIDTFPDSLKRLYMDVSSYDYVESYTLPTFKTFQHLEYLKLRIPHSTIELDMLLNSCPCITHLIVEAKFINLSSTDASTKDWHKLKTLEVRRSAASSQIFKYLSYRCRSLVAMHLSQVDIIGPPSELSRQMYLDMSFTHFHTLFMNIIRFFVVDDTGAYDEEKPINIVTLDRYTHIPQFYDPKLREIPSWAEHAPYASFCMMWWHYYYDTSSNLGRRRIRRLLDKDGYHVSKFYSKHYVKVEQVVPVRTVRKRHPGGLLHARFWRGDLPNGFVKIQVGYLDTYYLEHKQGSFSH
ncbi:hypothetical protein CLU79DRAFT_775473, partial [Phycomyces nitens]